MKLTKFFTLLPLVLVSLQVQSMNNNLSDSDYDAKPKRYGASVACAYCDRTFAKSTKGATIVAHCENLHKDKEPGYLRNGIWITNDARVTNRLWDENQGKKKKTIQKNVESREIELKIEQAERSDSSPDSSSSSNSESSPMDTNRSVSPKNPELLRIMNASRHFAPFARLKCELPKLYLCKYCGKTFKSPELYTLHNENCAQQYLTPAERMQLKAIHTYIHKNKVALLRKVQIMMADKQKKNASTNNETQQAPK